MKKIILFSSAVLLSLMGYAQLGIKIIRVGGTHTVNDSVIVVSGSSELLTIPLHVVDTTNYSIGLKVRRIDSVAPAHTSNYFCWGLCYGAQSAPVWVGPSPDTVHAHDTDKTFTADYNDSNHNGTAIFKYSFFDRFDDSAWVIVKFNATPLGIGQIAENGLHFSAPYPNPAKSEVSFSYNLNGVKEASLDVYNTLGQSVRSLLVNNYTDRLNLDVSSLPAGIYICKLGAEGVNPVFQKLIVTH
jgi:hypothetical protein